MTNDEKNRVRTLCGYPRSGESPPPEHRTWCFLWRWGILSYRLESLTTGEQTVVHRYVQMLSEIESADQSEQNTRLYITRRHQLCDFISVKPGPMLPDRSWGLTS